MLRGVPLHLAAKGHAVSVMARGQEALAELERAAAEKKGKIFPVVCDYADGSALRQSIETIIDQRGPFDLVVAWTREAVPRAQGMIARLANEAARKHAGKRCRFFRILGSLAGDPARLRLGKDAEFRAEGTRTMEAAFHHTLECIAYREIMLGFHIEGNTSRWNTNEEIQAGVINAVENDLLESIIGVLTPWEMNPRALAKKQ